jgi:PAS domain S-box-containing protein
MIAICDENGIIRYASPSSEALLGALPNELTGQRIRRRSDGSHVRACSTTWCASRSEALTFAIENESGDLRSFKMVIANHAAWNRSLLTLNIRDVSDAARNEHLRAPRSADAAREPRAVLRSRTPGHPPHRRRHDARGAVSISTTSSGQQPPAR